MSILKTLFEEVEQEVKDVEAQQPEDPLKDYALYIDAGRHSSDYVLYKPRYYAQEMKKEISNAKTEYNKIRFKGDQFGKFDDFYAFSNVKDVFKDPKGVYGFMSINNGRIIGLRGSCNRANEVRSIAAREGFGRLMFMIGLAKESPIMPNREKVSDKAYNYWQNMDSNSQVETDDFENELRLQKKQSDDCKVFGDPVLDRSYKTKQDMSLELQPLINRHKDFLNQMRNYFEKTGVDYILSRLKEYIADAGNYFFEEQRGEEGWYMSFEVGDE